LTDTFCLQCAEQTLASSHDEISSMVFEKSVRLKRRRSSLLVPQVRSHGVTHDEQETKNIEADADFY